jgi:hypothetical protein
MSSKGSVGKVNEPQIYPPRANELRPEFLHTAGINPFQREDSSARVNMLASSHISQALVVKGATPRRTLTGVERKFGGTTFKIKMPCNGTILKIIEKYPGGVGYNAIKANPVSYMIYEDTETREIGILELPVHHCLHQHFGFRYKYTAASQRLYVGAHIARGTILADSPSVTAEGDYSYGVNTNIALMSIPGVIEDGVVVSESYVKKLQSTGFETTIEQWGKEWYPLNLYGDDSNYKVFPDIGERIGPDGLLMMLRRQDDMLAPVEMTAKSLRSPDMIYDRPIYAIPGAKILDITIKHDGRLNPPPTPVGMTTQTERYYNDHQLMYKDVVKFYQDLKRQRASIGLKITKEFSNFLVEAMTETDDSGKDKSVRMYRRIPLDDWRIEITYEYDINPTETFKITGCHGNKGVICDVWPDDDMPVDQWGNRAEIIMDDTSIVKRMNSGVLSEQFINAASRQVSNDVRTMMADTTVDNTMQCWHYLLGYYRIVSPKMYDLITTPSYKGTPESHVAAVLNDGVYLWLPTDNPMDAPQIIRNIMAQYPVNIGPVVYRGRSGRVVTTKNPVLIASTYVLLLEKTGNDWSAVSSAKLQHFGLPSRLTNRDKHTAPGRNHPVRLLGEDEVRLVSATVGSDVAAELLEMSNNPTLHKHMMGNILLADQPTNIDNIVDRTLIPHGNARPLVFVRHMLESAGMAFAYRSPNDSPSSVYSDTGLVADDLEIIADDLMDKNEDGDD